METRMSTPSSWWAGLTDAQFCVAHRRELPRILTDTEGMKLVPLSTYHDLAMWPRRSGFAGTGQGAR
jgi:hypothetical protein